MLKWLGKGIFPGKFGCALEMSMAIVLWHARTSATIGSVACPPSILEAVVSGRSRGHASAIIVGICWGLYNETLPFVTRLEMSGVV
jgi:hypothetical protein